MENQHSTDFDDLVRAARQLVAAKQALALRLPAGYATDAAVVILFSLFSSEGAGLSENAICDQSTASPGVTRRWLNVLIHDALIEKNEDGPEPRYRLTVHGRFTAIATLGTIGEAWMDIRNRHEAPAKIGSASA